MRVPPTLSDLLEVAAARLRVDWILKASEFLWAPLRSQRQRLQRWATVYTTCA